MRRIFNIMVIGLGLNVQAHADVNAVNTSQADSAADVPEQVYESASFSPFFCGSKTLISKTLHYYDNSAVCFKVKTCSDDEVLSDVDGACGQEAYYMMTIYGNVGAELNGVPMFHRSKGLTRCTDSINAMFLSSFYNEISQAHDLKRVCVNPQGQFQEQSFDARGLWAD